MNLDDARAEVRAELGRLWADGSLTLAEVAARLGMTRAATYAAARRAGLPPRPNVTMAATWTAERDQLGAELWKSGLSAALCLPNLNALPGLPIATLAAVQFRAAKLGWKRGAAVQRERKWFTPAPWPDFGAEPLDLTVPDPTLGMCRTRLPDAAAAPGMCAWPFGDPHDRAAFRFCAEAVAPGGGAYCGLHWRIAYPGSARATAQAA